MGHGHLRAGHEHHHACAGPPAGRPLDKRQAPGAFLFPENGTSSASNGLHWAALPGTNPVRHTGATACPGAWRCGSRCLSTALGHILSERADERFMPPYVPHPTVGCPGSRWKDLGNKKAVSFDFSRLYGFPGPSLEGYLVGRGNLN